MMNRISLVSPMSLFLATILYIVANTLLGTITPVARLDVTKDRLYTLSQGTRQILLEIDDPIELHLFISEQISRELPLYASYERRIRELLAEIVSASRGKVILREYNPKPFSEDEDTAVSFGVQGVPIEQGGNLAYFGLAGINSVKEVELIPFFRTDREKLLEYDIVRLIYGLSNTDPVTAGVISSLPIMGDMSSHMDDGVLVPWGIGGRLKRDFEIINLPESIDVLPKEIDVLMIVHPRALSDRAIYEIEQFLFRGGRAMLFIDPKSESDLSLGPNAASASTHGLQPLFQQWGIRISDQLVGDKSLALRINAGTVARPIPTNFLVWLGISGDHLNQSDPITSQLPALNFASAGVIIREEDSPLVAEPLVSTSTNSGLIAVEDVQGAVPDVFGVLEKFRPDEKTYVLATRLTGSVSTAFPGGAPQQTITETEQERTQVQEPVQLLKSKGSINIIVVADSDLLEDRFWLRKRQFFGREIEESFAGNADFVINSLDNLTGSDALLTLRTRGVSRYYFEKTRELQQQAESRLQDRERVLRDTLKKIQDKIINMEGARAIKDAEDGELKVEVTLTSEQHAEIESLRRNMVTTRKQLRALQRKLREDVERLESRLQFVNIGLIPLIISGIAATLGIARMIRARRSYRVIRESQVA